MSEAEDLRGRLESVRAEMAERAAAITAKRIALEADERAYKRLGVWAGQLNTRLHEIEGEARNCAGHEYVSGPSTRGIGFDDQCKHCGHFRTLYPIY